MNEPQAYINGQLIPASKAAVPLYDSGLVLGTAVTEQMRTFGGRLFRLEDHLARLARSLEIIEIAPELTPSQFGQIAHDLAAKNYSHLEPGDDLGLGIFVTPGGYAPLLGSHAATSGIYIYTFRLAFGLWAEKFERGESIVISSIEQVSPRTWPPELKCRSRMHYFLADREAASIDPGARAILLDEHGQVTETTTANIIMYRRDVGLVSPPADKILPGISLNTVAELAAELAMPFLHRDIDPTELAEADEILLSSTSSCLLPVVRLDRRPVGTGRPGEIYNHLLSAWNHRVGLDIVAQARRFATRKGGIL